MTGTTDELSPAILQAAADWLVHLHSGEATERDRQQIRLWCDEHPDHAAAWERAQQFLQHFERIPAAIGRSALDAPTSPERRRAINQLAVLLAVGPAMWVTWRYAPWRELSADFRTGTGEQRQLSFDDGSRVMLNTGTAIEVSFDAVRRYIKLIDGEIFATAARDTARPLIVENRHGSVRTFEGSFAIRQFERHSRVAAFTGTLDVAPASAREPVQHIVAGQQSLFDSYSIAPAEAASPLSRSWTQGMLIARQMPLSDLVAELSRYQRGLLRCDPAVAGIRVSGAFPVTDVALSLNMLRNTFPVRIHSVTRYWTTVGPAA